MTRHPNLPPQGGQPYVMENVFRALRNLCDADLPWKDRISMACLDAHRPSDNEAFTGYMADDTLEYWRNCAPGRFGKPVSALDENEVRELADSLRAYIFSGSRDRGICIAGGDPKAHEPFDAVPEIEGGKKSPIRHNI